MHPAHAAIYVKTLDPEVARLRDLWNDAAPDSAEETDAAESLRVLLNYQVVNVSFGADKKSRVIGAEIVTWEIAGTFCARPHATRDGREYGAGQNVQKFASADERDRWRDKYLAGARKRAQSKERKYRGLVFDERNTNHRDPEPDHVSRSRDPSVDQP